MQLSGQNQNIHSNLSSLKTPMRQAFGEISNRPRYINNFSESRKLSNTKVTQSSEFLKSKIIENEIQDNIQNCLIDDLDVNYAGCLPGFERIVKEPSLWNSCLDKMFFRDIPDYSINDDDFHDTNVDFSPFEPPKLEQIPSVNFDFEFI